MSHRDHPGGAPIHLRPTARLAERALLPGDPGRALALAQSLLSEPRMFNHHRGLWGYTGVATDGEQLTIQSTGIGGPSAAIVLSELIALGCRRAIRVGTCGALAPSLALGDLVVARESICADGTSRALGACERVSADPSLTDSLMRSAPSAHAGTIVSVDLFYASDPRCRSGQRRSGRQPHREEHSVRHASAHEALAVEMEAAALFAVGAAAQVPVACVLAVSDTFDSSGNRTRIADDPLLAAADRMGALAVSALGA
jgi:uridine phosphorylase